jgi:hypothetical protein
MTLGGFRGKSGADLNNQCIELLKKGRDVWLVAYFRWHVDRFRLFIGALRWSKTPAEIEEIVTPERLKAVLAEVQAKP